MYPNFIEESNELKRLGIKRTFLANEVLSIGDKLFHDRIYNSIPFEKEEIDKMYEYIKSKGYKKSKKYLFTHIGNSIEKKANKNETRLSYILKIRMKEKNITNEKLSEVLNVSEDTISNWRSGKIENIRDKEILKSLCEYLSINVLYLLGITDNPNEVYISKKYENNKLTSELIFNDYLKTLIDYSNFYGIEGIDIKNINSIQKTILRNNFERFIENQLFALTTMLDIPYDYFMEKKLENRIEISDKRNEIVGKLIKENKQLFNKLKQSQSKEDMEKYDKKLSENISQLLETMNEFDDVLKKEKSDISEELDELEDEFLNR